MRLLAPALLLALAACGDRPPAQTAADAPTYATDLDACRDAAATAVNKRNAKTGLAWLASPVRRWGQIDDEVQACLAGRGHGRVRTCTDAELRAGNRATNARVTASGITCTDPPSPGKRG